MTIQGLDAWLTTPPEEPDVVEYAEKLLERFKKNPPKNEEEGEIEWIINGLLEMVNEM